MPLSTATRNAAADAFVDLADADSGTPTLELGTDASFTTTPLIFSLDNSAAFAAAVGGSCSFTGAPITATASATATCTHKRIKDRDGTVLTSVDEIVDAVVDLIDVGSGTAVVEFGDSGLVAVYASYNLNDPAFGASSGGLATANGFPKSATASGTGTATDYQVKDKNGTVVLSLVLPSSFDFVASQSYDFNSFTFTTSIFNPALASSLNVTIGQDYNLNAISAYTQPAS